MTEPVHSLVRQSYLPREMSAGTVNADGYGFAWYDGRSEAPYRYRHTIPIWSDVNLADQCRYVETGHLLAYVRSATPGQALDMANTQPFVHGRWSFVHNGFIDGFSAADGVPLRRAMQAALDDTHWPLAGGGTDSAHLFAWLMQHLSAGAPASTIPAALAALKDLPGLSRVGLNFLLSDGAQLLAVRHALGTDCPTLYILRGHDEDPGTTFVASEPLFDDPGWHALPANSLTIIASHDSSGDQPISLAA